MGGSRSTRNVVIVGANIVGASLVRALPASWKLTLIDVVKANLDAVTEREGGAPLVRIVGDGTSRLVLELAGVRRGTLLLAVTESDAVNVEVARMARAHFKVEDIVVVTDDLDEVDEVGLPRSAAVVRSGAVTAAVTNRVPGLDARGVGVGQGRGELRQVRVQEGSRALGKTLRELSPRNWLVAAVYRGERLLVPHGDTTLEPDDAVLLVGEPEVVEAVASFIGGGRPMFPTQWGEYVGVVGGEAAQAFARFLVESTGATDVLQCSEAELDVDLRSHLELAQSMEERSVGALVLEPRPVSFAARLGLTVSRRKQMLLSLRRPVWVARGSPPVRRVLVCVGGAQDVDAIGGVAVDLAALFDATLTALTVVPPTLVGPDEGEYEALPAHVARLGRLAGREVERVVDHGNPIERIRHHAQEADLLVVGHSTRHVRSSLLNPDVSLFLLHQAPCSTLFVPWNPVRR